MKSNSLLGIFGIIIVTIIITITVLYNKDTLQTQDNISPYSTQYDDLVNRYATVSIKIPIEKFSENNLCYKISEKEFDAFPDKLRTYIDDAKNNILGPEQMTKYSKDSFNLEAGLYYYDGAGGSISSKEALTFLKNYSSFIGKQDIINLNLQNLTDTKYHFTCNVEYQNIDYNITFVFDSQYANNGKITFVNFTKDGGIPKIENQNIRVYQGGFNSTVVFKNQLDHDLVLVNDGPIIKKDDLMIDKKILIPKGKMWSFPFNIDNFYQDTDSSKYPRSNATFQYHIEPDNLKGIITVKLHPGCMTEIEVKSLYSVVMAYPKFPSHLPDGYSFECGVHHTYWAVNLVYLDENGRKKMSEASEPLSHFAKESLIDSNALIISYWNGYIANYWQKDPTYDKFEHQKNAMGFKESKPVTISGEPAVLYTDYYPDRRSVNTLEIFTDNAITYTIAGNFTDNELVKVAESLFAE